MQHKHRVCPWWFAYTFDNPLRLLFHNTQRLLGPYVQPGMTVLDAGCGMGFFSIGLARLTGPQGTVIAVDLQEKMLEKLRLRAQRAGVLDIIRPRLSTSEDLHLSEELDFALAFWMVHEVPDTGGFFKQIRAVLKPGGKMLITEPFFHVSAQEFKHTVTLAESCGFQVLDRPRISFSRSALLVAA